jgi:hypothetical protein
VLYGVLDLVLWWYGAKHPVDIHDDDPPGAGADGLGMKIQGE